MNEILQIPGRLLSRVMDHVYVTDAGAFADPAMRCDGNFLRSIGTHPAEVLTNSTWPGLANQWFQYPRFPSNSSMGSGSASTFTVSMLGSVVGTLRLCSKRSLSGWSPKWSGLLLLIPSAACQVWWSSKMVYWRTAGGSVTSLTSRTAGSRHWTSSGRAATVPHMSAPQWMVSWTPPPRPSMFSMEAPVQPAVCFSSRSVSI